MYRTVIKLDNGFDLVFCTDRAETVCICEEIGYHKQIALHDGKRATYKQLHESVKHLFDQYVKDANRQPTLIAR
jgi:hypothetical protein